MLVLVVVVVTIIISYIWYKIKIVFKGNKKYYPHSIVEGGDTTSAITRHGDIKIVITIKLYISIK